MTVKETAAFLRQHDNYLILTHKRPDGDTIGCAAALCEGLRALGRTAWICPHTEETHLFTPYPGPGGLCSGDGGERGHRRPQPVHPGWRTLAGAGG